MAGDELSLFSWMVLGLVGRGGAGPHDLRRMAQQGRVLDWAGESQYYVEPKRLARLGYLEATKEPGKTRERTVYRLTDKGEDALREWASTPAQFPRLKHEPLIRLLVADLVGDQATAEGIAALRGEIADLRGRLDEAKAVAETLPHRRKYLLLAYDLVERLFELHLEWVDEVERELAADAAERVLAADEPDG
jgi:PadR family transcriptional regulator, regulatory protein AphA